MYEPHRSSRQLDATALRLQSFYTGVECCLLQIVRVLNGCTPDGAGGHRRALGLLLGFRHLVRQRLSAVLMLWPRLCADLQAFAHGFRELMALAETGRR